MDHSNFMDQIYLDIIKQMEEEVRNIYLLNCFFFVFNSIKFHFIFLSFQWPKAVLSSSTDSKVISMAFSSILVDSNVVDSDRGSFYLYELVECSISNAIFSNNQGNYSSTDGFAIYLYDCDSFSIKGNSKKFNLLLNYNCVFFFLKKRFCFH